MVSAKPNGKLLHTHPCPQLSQAAGQKEWIPAWDKRDLSKHGMEKSTALDKNVLKSTSEEISAETGNPVHPIPANLRDPEAVKASVDQFVEICGGLPDVIINNAAANFVAPTERLSPNAWKAVVDVVLNGTVYTTLEIGKRLIEQEKGL
ncbi:2,4-dienoyl-CoA reductase [(3E)-enoyl-CoA-producing], mitochondrial-like [Lytechinus pictus]|uniref:2,4-dienoyl-CoA reductase [(3E)-enoyl-CoA-producing], mitochondrial-like n=1 Tax=Lytechinus pictus TaxID=7653 RepID=UPI0030B9D012